jgi:high affinity Mn2+ porin
MIVDKHGSVALCALTLAVTVRGAFAQQPPDATEPTTVFARPDTDRAWLSGQMNIIFQTHPAFPARYSGEHSLLPTAEQATSTLLTLYTGLRLTTSTELIFDAESAGGSGISDALGLAGFTNLDVVRNPTLGAAPYVARVMLHQTIALGSERMDVDRTPFAFSRSMPVRRLEWRLGKFGTADFFDQNAVGSDSHLQFMNWSVDSNGGYDYAADTRGYTWGGIVEFHDRQWALRFGELLMPKIANGIDLDWNLARAHAENLEVEWHPTIRQRPTTVRAVLRQSREHGRLSGGRPAVRKRTRRRARHREHPRAGTHQVRLWPERRPADDERTPWLCALGMERAAP